MKQILDFYTVHLFLLQKLRAILISAIDKKRIFTLKTTVDMIFPLTKAIPTKTH